MAKALSQQDVRQFALIGAQARLEVLQAELKALLASFPELGRASRRTPAAAPAASAAAAARRRKKRSYNMTAEQKQAVSDRMKKYLGFAPQGEEPLGRASLLESRHPCGGSAATGAARVFAGLA